jgi:hypothetical protein
VTPAGRPPKNPDQKVGHYQPETLIGEVVDVPAPPSFICPEPPLASDGKELLPEMKLLWEAYWFSPVVHATDLLDADGHPHHDSVQRPVLVDWVRSRNRLAVIEMITTKTPLVEGSQGQPRVNPLVSVETFLRTVINRCEEVLGLTPLHAARLGITKGAEAMTAASLNKELNEAGGIRHSVDTSPAVLEVLTIAELRALGQEYGVRGMWKMNKPALARALSAVM